MSNWNKIKQALGVQPKILILKRHPKIFDVKHLNQRKLKQLNKASLGLLY